MITGFLLFVFCCLLCSAFIFKSTFFNITSFSKRSLAGLFIGKASAGVLAGYFSSHIFSGDDSWFYFEMGKQLQQFALENPMQYLKLLLEIGRATRLNSSHGGISRMPSSA